MRQTNPEPVGKPHLIRTGKILQFGELSHDDFERLCLWLVEREGFLHPQHLGASGGEQGRDIIAYRSVALGEELWYFQCKRYKEIGTADLKAEVDKYTALAASDPSKTPAGVIFVTSASVTERVRDEVSKYCSSCGYRCVFWARSELDMLVKKYPDLVAEFFGTPDPLPPPALNQLPPPPPDFAGRTTELEELIAAVEQGTTVVALFGMGGVGKTALARKLAERLAPSYPDARIHLDLKGTSREPLRASDVMHHVIRSYLPAVKPSNDRAEAEASYRSVLHRQKALLLLDNVAGRKQVESLVPPAGCLLLITSRQKFHLPGAVSVRVEPLPREDSRALLVSIAPRIGEQGGTVAELCGGLPLALRVAAGALAERVDISAADYARRLSDTRQRLELVKATFRLSYDLLTPLGRRLWRRLAVFPGTFDADGAAYIWGVETEVARVVLSEMVKLSLLDWEATADRYRLHDLARLYAKERLRSNERRDVYVRHANYYGALLEEANSLYDMGGVAAARGLSNFDTEWHNFQAAQTWAQENSGTDDDAASICNAIPNAGGYLLDLRQHPLERIRWLEAALEAARKLNARDYESGHLANIGVVYTSIGEPRRAIELLERALAIDLELNDRRGEAKILGSLGNAYSALGEPRRAAEFYEQDLLIVRGLGDRRGEATALNNLGNTYAALGETAKAFSHYERALTAFKEMGEPQGVGAVLGSLGLLYSDLGDDSRALELHQQALSISRQLRNIAGEAQEIGNLGQSLCRLGDYQGALECHQQQLEIARELCDRHSEAGALSAMGSTYFFQRNERSATECYEQAVKIYQGIGDRYREGRVLGNWGNLYARSGEPLRALDFYERQLATAREVGDRRGEANALWNKSWAFSKIGDFARAVEHGEPAVEIYEAMGDINQAAKSRKNLAEWRGEL